MMGQAFVRRYLDWPGFYLIRDSISTSLLFGELSWLVIWARMWCNSGPAKLTRTLGQFYAPSLDIHLRSSHVGIWKLIISINTLDDSIIQSFWHIGTYGPDTWATNLFLTPNDTTSALIVAGVYRLKIFKSVLCLFRGSRSTLSLCHASVQPPWML